MGIKQEKLLEAKPTIERYGKTHPWAPDGIYDDRKLQTRYWVKDGRAQEVASILWIESFKVTQLSPAMQAAWGTYPDMPPRPPKVLTE